jgi:acetylornithine/N-succinyldiaminopimelate aminotransferase
MIMTSSLSQTYSPLPITFDHGQGVWLWDTTGKKYLDGLSGIAVCSLGHAHPAITAAITEQAGKLLHTSNLYHILDQQKLAEKLIQLSGMQQAFFCNSGAEANEAAIKLTRLYGRKKEITHPAIVVMEKSFHGRTLATLSASGSRRIQAGYEPLVQGYVRAPYNDIEALRTIAKHTHDIVAVMLEPIQGEGGVLVPDPNYLKEVRQLCDEHEWLMILDEVQTGIGRTGKMFAYQYADIIPDVLALAKALGNGIPIGACLMSGKAAHLFEPGKHGSTFGGNPLASHTALAVLDTIEKEHLLSNATKMGEYLLKGLKKNLSQKPHVKDIRGKGLMIGVEMDKPCKKLLNIGLEEGVLFSVTAESVIRILPPLIIKQPEVDLLIEKITRCVDRFDEIVTKE